jgi:hypothetical protein
MQDGRGRPSYIRANINLTLITKGEQDELDGEDVPPASASPSAPGSNAR